MKVSAINGSARKDGNTDILIGRIFEQLEAAGIETENDKEALANMDNLAENMIRLLKKTDKEGIV